MRTIRAIAVTIVLLAMVAAVPLLMGSANLQKLYEVTVDNVSHAMLMTNMTHHKIHAGENYFIKTSFEDSGGDEHVTYFAFTTPDTTERIHAKAAASPDVDFTIEIYEGAVITDGTPLIEQNNDRENSNPASLIAVADPNVISPGDLIWSARNGGGKNPVGVSPAFSYEIIAKRNATYLFKMTKKVVQVGIVDIDFWWYEQTPIE